MDKACFLTHKILSFLTFPNGQMIKKEAKCKNFPSYLFLLHVPGQCLGEEGDWARSMELLNNAFNLILLCSYR